MVTFETSNEERALLTTEGTKVLETGSVEAKIFATIKGAGEAGVPLKDINAQYGNDAKMGLGALMKTKSVKKGDGDALSASVDTYTDKTKADLATLQETGQLSDARALIDLKKKKFVTTQKVTSYSISKGPQFALEIKKLETDLTVELLANNKWKEAEFKSYNFDAEGVPVRGGALHPLLKVREEFRQIFFDMGFQEMPTNKFVESSFWNFDALFVPQQHPARDVQDTFYIKDPAAATDFPKEYFERVRKVHQNGGYGSIGYGVEWSAEEAGRLVLRTHTTAVSSAMLYKLAQEKEFKPAKFFSIDRVFRNETVDATHLAEFHQVEGVIADFNITLGDLIGFMEIFFGKMGITNLRFKPAYNPYTEPSMEIFSYHEGLKKWVEVGNSGMFRPEMLEPMGLPKNVRVLGWGLSLERPTMIKYGISNIRELVGHKCNLDMIENSPIVRF